MKCGQKTCENEATKVFQWPGQPGPLPVCDACAARAVAVGQAMGIDVPVIELGLYRWALRILARHYLQEVF